MELRDEHIIRAVSSCEAMEALLQRFQEIARPGKGAPIVLAALARLGTTACTWLEGELRIDIAGDATHTKIAISTSLGAGFREKPFRDTLLRVPLDEFLRGIMRAPHIIEPLEVKESGKADPGTNYIGSRALARRGESATPSRNGPVKSIGTGG